MGRMSPSLIKLAKQHFLQQEHNRNRRTASVSCASSAQVGDRGLHLTRSGLSRVSTIKGHTCTSTLHTDPLFTLTPVPQR